jgi:NAD+ synthase (glutamine-hydrolysing)
MQKLILAQINAHVGNIQANTEKICASIHLAREQGASLIIFPELAVTGYPPEDLLFRDDFHTEVQTALKTIATASQHIHVIVGYPNKTDLGIYNSAAVFFNGKMIAHYDKQCLPNYGVFDEQRYFIPGNKPCIVKINKIKYGLLICEDLWFDAPIKQAKNAGAEFIIGINASPFDLAKPAQRFEVLREKQKLVHLPILYTNLIGGQDELIFDGGSFVLNAHGECIAQAAFFKEALLSISLNHFGDVEKMPAVAPLPSEEELVYNALVLATRDYIQKNKFPGILLGLSGGIDSALVLAIAVDALGCDKIETVMMPSRYTQKISLDDAKAEADILGVKHHELSIEKPFEAFLTTLHDTFAGLKPDTTEENIQARIRGVLLMAMSNKSGKLVLTTGNKSEMSVGYATLYGDMAGGFAPLKDVPKMLVYRLAEYRNNILPVIPERVITRAPSAELAPDQTDQDSLPPYAILDAIIERTMENNESIDAIVEAGFDLDTVKKVVKLIQRSEYKRRQSAVGPKITRRAYGKEWRMPITR